MEPPEKPDETDCCNSGCHPCIFDVYEEQLKRYEKYLKNPTQQKPVSNCIDQLKYTKFKLVSRIEHTVDTGILIFEYANPKPDFNCDKEDNIAVVKNNLLKGNSVCSSRKAEDISTCETCNIENTQSAIENNLNNQLGNEEDINIVAVKNDNLLTSFTGGNNLCGCRKVENRSICEICNFENTEKNINTQFGKDEDDLKTETKLFYKPGQHFLIKAYSRRDKINFTRAYTPIPWEDLKPQQFAVLVRFYENGEMSKYLKRLKTGSSTHWRGPYGDYEVPSIFPKHLLMVAQGTGIAPIYSVLSDLLNNEDCEVLIKLFYCCRDSEDVLLRENLYGFCKYWNFSYEVFISRGVIKGVKYNEVVHGKRLDFVAVEDFAKGKEGCFDVMVCGSEGFEGCVSGYVKKCGANNVYLF